MKKTLLIILAVIVNITVCPSQVTKKEDSNIGLQTQISPDKQYLKITYCAPGSVADISKLRAGDRIYQIDDKKVADLEDPTSSIRNASGKFLKLSICRFGKTDFYDVNVPIFSMNINSNNYFTEANLFLDIFHSSMFDFSSSIFNIGGLTITLLNDDEKDMFKYKTYDFDYTSMDESLNEKLILNKLGTQLNELGMKRSLDKPDLLIIIKFFYGKKEQYVPPQQIISTRIKNTYNWYWGITPVPITESTEKEGYTTVTYLTTLCVKFLDANEIETSKTPPVVWSGSIVKTENIERSLTEQCSDYFQIMLYQFPEVWRKSSVNYYPRYYAYLGLIYNKDDMRTIGYVIPGSPSDKIGILPGDKIQSINGNSISNKYKFKYDDALGYLRMFSRMSDRNLDATIELKIKRNGNLMIFNIKPEAKVVFLLENNL